MPPFLPGKCRQRNCQGDSYHYEIDEIRALNRASAFIDGGNRDIQPNWKILTG